MAPGPAVKCVEELIATLGAPSVRTDAAELARRAHDVSYHTPHTPFAVVAPRSEQDIAAILRICNKYAIPVIAVAGATSLEGHIIPLQSRGAVIIDLSEMDRIVEVHADDLDCVVEPGVGWVELREQLEPLGLFFPPDPGASACIGGMCGTNCSGTLAWRYGTMKDHVLSLRVVLPDGTVIKTRRRATKSSAGYDLTRLFVGSEGTLGVISQATLRLRRIPKHTLVVIAQFASLEDAGASVADVVHKGLILNRMELMDDVTIHATNLSISNPENRFPELTTLLFECAGLTPADIQEQVTSLDAITAANHRTLFRYARDEAESERLWHLRKRAYFAAKDLRKGIKTDILTTDVAVPISHLVSALAASRRDLTAMGLTGAMVAHAGDGNIHVLLAIDASNREEVSRAQTFRDNNARLALSLGGTCTGEHGIGVGKIHLLEEEVGLETVDLMRRIKGVIDPNGIMNPGKVFREGPGSGTAVSLSQPKLASKL